MHRRAYPLTISAALLAAILIITAPAHAADDAESIAKQGDSLLQQRNFPAAVEAYRKALQLKPDLDTARQNFAMALVESGKPDEAAAQVQELIRRNPKEGRYHRDLAA